MILLLGGHGRLGGFTRRALAYEGLDHVAPPRATLDAADADGVAAYARDVGARLVLSLVALADVRACDADEERSRRENVVATARTASAAERAGVPLLWCSSDYVAAFAVGGCPAGPGAVLDVDARSPCVYAQDKMRGEVALQRFPRATAFRVAFADPDDVPGWGWVDGYQMANREWIEDTAHRVGALARLALRGPPLPPVVHLGPPGLWVTRADLVRQRFPQAQCLRHVVCSPAERVALGAPLAPGDTRLDDCLPLMPRDRGYVPS